MNLFVKKILAKYVKYIEIIGYGFVLLFIAGLVALSFIKAEDEFVHLNGRYEMPLFVPKFSQPHCLVAVHADSAAMIAPGAPLFEITGDTIFCAEKAILADLQIQARRARISARPELARQLEAVIEHTPLAAPTGVRLIRSEIAGQFFWLDATGAGGVFDFAQSALSVTEFPPDRRQQKKLQMNQTGTATFPAAGLSLPVKLVQLTEHEAIFHVDSLKTIDKIQLAQALAQSETGGIPASLAVRVGWRSWMELIWR